MSFNQRVLTLEQADEFLDKARKVGVKPDPDKRFMYLAEESEDNEFPMQKEFYNHFFKSFSESDLYRNSILPRKTSIPSVYFSTEEYGKEWTFHRDDFKVDDMVREYSVILSLSDPDEYEGGDCVILNNGMETSMKLPKGYMAIFPSSSYVKFEKVISGNRTVVRWATEVGLKNHTEFELNMRYQQLYSAFKSNLSPQAEELFFVANNMLANYFMKDVD